MDLHYNGFCNSVLWQLFHYVPLNTDTKLSETRTLQFQWNAYQDANRRASVDGCSLFSRVGWAGCHHISATRLTVSGRMIRPLPSAASPQLLPICMLLQCQAIPRSPRTEAGL